MLYNFLSMNDEAKTMSIVGLLSLLLLVGGVWGLSKLSQSTKGGGNVENLEVGLDESDHVIGDKGLLIVEYADFQCSACAAAHPMNKQVIEKYKGKIKWVFKHFPLSFHKNAVRAAEAAEAAGVQGKFWEMHDKLFEKQAEWSELTDPGDMFVDFAQELGLDKNKFEQDIKSGKLRAKIEKDRKQGLVLGINATPTFIVGGKKYVGGLSADQWRKLIVD
jgi:protein-disulfide isomerase